MKAAHPQRSAGDGEPMDSTAESAAASQAPGAPFDVLASNPFPPAVTVPGRDGPVEVRLERLDGVVYAPDLLSLPLDPHIRQYVTQFCAVWSQSVLTVPGKVRYGFPEPPRTAQIVLGEAQMHAMLGLADDESLVGVVVDPLTTQVRFVVQSPRLAPKPEWGVEPPIVQLPLAASYEGRREPGEDVDELTVRQRQLAALEARLGTFRRETEAAIAEARRRVDELLAGEAAQQAHEVGARGGLPA